MKHKSKLTEKVLKEYMPPGQICLCDNEACPQGHGGDFCDLKAETVVYPKSEESGTPMCGACAKFALSTGKYEE